MSEKPRQLTHANLSCAAAYEKAEPAQFGNLHERMKFLIKSYEQVNGTYGEDLVRVAIMDLETEVMHYTPAIPPYGQRYVPYQLYASKWKQTK